MFHNENSLFLSRLNENPYANVKMRIVFMTPKVTPYFGWVYCIHFVFGQSLCSLFVFVSNVRSQTYYSFEVSKSLKICFINKFASLLFWKVLVRSNAVNINKTEAKKLFFWVSVLWKFGWLLQLWPFECSYFYCFGYCQFSLVTFKTLWKKKLIKGRYSWDT